MIKKIALNLLVLLYTSQLIAGPHYSDALNDDGGGGSSDFGLWVVGIIFLLFFFLVIMI